MNRDLLTNQTDHIHVLHTKHETPKDLHLQVDKFFRCDCE